MEGVERVEELLLGLGLALEELDVVEEQDIDMAEARLEVIGLPVAERAEELVREGLTRRATNTETGTVREQQAGDRAQKVRLAHTGRAAHEQRVIGLCGHFRDGQRGGVSEAVAVADHE